MDMLHIQRNSCCKRCHDILQINMHAGVGSGSVYPRSPRTLMSWSSSLAGYHSLMVLLLLH